LLYYEKYHQTTPDLNLLRSHSFQNEQIINALNFYLIVLMVSIHSTHSKETLHARNYIISLIFALYVFEAHLILTGEIIL
jgi:hypothetical protein